MKKDRTSLASSNKVLQQQAGESNQFASTFAARIVASTLKGKAVVIIGMPGASSSMKDALSKEIGQAGGTVSGRLQFTSDYTDPKRASDVASLVTSVHPLGLQLPTTSGPAG